MCNKAFYNNFLHFKKYIFYYHHGNFNLSVLTLLEIVHLVFKCYICIYFGTDKLL